MDKINSAQKSSEKRKKHSLFKTLSASLKEGILERKRERYSILVDIAVFLCALAFGARHIIFGAYPLGIALVAVLPSRVWLAAIGASLGALSLGGAGIIYSMISVIVVFLRVIVSGTDVAESTKTDKTSLFSESLLLRMSSALIGGFICATYEVLLSGLTLASVAFGLSMILLPPIITFAFSGLFDAGMSLSQLLFEKSAPLSLEGKSEKERFDLIFFQCSALAMIFLLGISLEEYSFLGINPSFIFSGAVTLFVAKRFGAIRAGAVGFISLLGISSTHAVSFALLGVSAGLLFNIGSLYAALGGGAAVCLWSAYSSGTSGLLSVLPEYIISATLIFPAFKKLQMPPAKTKSESEEVAAKGLVSMASLCYQSNFNSVLGELGSALSSISSSVRKYSNEISKISKEDCLSLFSKCAKEYCSSCKQKDTCKSKSRLLAEENLEVLTTMLYKNRQIYLDELLDQSVICEDFDGLVESINRAISILELEGKEESPLFFASRDILFISKLISEAKRYSESEMAHDTALSDAVVASLSSIGLGDALVKVLGERKKHFIISLPDPDGTRITSQLIIPLLEELSGVKLSAPDYFRQGSVALMECDTKSSYDTEYFGLSLAGKSEAVCGDMFTGFNTKDSRFFALISDGVGSGKEASLISGLVLKFIKSAAELGEASIGSLSLLNSIIKRQKDEYSATIDLFSLDLILGEAYFIKSGAAVSYIKRGSSLFRIRSSTAPVGILPKLDAEKIKVDVKSGDYIIMISDGVFSGTDDGYWLPELLSKKWDGTVKEYAEKILDTAKTEEGTSDDMTVVVVKIKEKI